MIQINRQRLLERFLKYVQVGTTANPKSDQYPSTECQRDLGKILAQELVDMGASDVRQDEHGLVYATIPSNVKADHAPVVALLAHVDTSPDAPGHSVRPQVIESYPGGNIPLESGEVITPDACPDLKELVGKTLITTDGTTLLGGDDKAGVAIIAELAQTLLENPQLLHGDLKVVFTCDEEIGHGTDKIDLQALAADVAYTLDGGGEGIIDVETFSADGATVKFIGDSIHPAIAKDRMINALRGAADFIAALPRETDTPETTAGRQGFIHANTIVGQVAEVTVDLILRSFDTDDLGGYADQLRKIAAQVESDWPGLKVVVEVRKQYRNLGEGLANLPQSIDLAVKAFKNLGRPFKKEIIRGGTDGSVLTEKGLPTPNLSSGQHNIHSVREFACLDEMVAATEHLVELLKLWSDERL
ncbi:peptidase T [Rhodopirellula sp. MGV]|uniref:peptidase T n=1 Tax=Rhodopirellula sp. MGV TaxID=2023130 RepID=UPI000B95D1BD|nr:peptidase T [Rhodopirellula sp. MGV]OYP36410.1 peptidase T [Rhodopirellula sp. MGV]PNY36837.1 peptidase T [Rhodopirellula baltica]